MSLIEHVRAALRAPAEPLRFVRTSGPAALERFAEDSGIPVSKLTASWRGKNRISHARQAAYAYIREQCPHLSFPQIGRLFNRDHASVIYGIRAHQARLDRFGSEEVQ